MADFVRFFTCASLVGLAGFSATSSMLACSDSEATAPAGDDDDDDTTPGKKDGGSTSSSSSSSSSSTGGGGDGGACAPEGTYTLGKPVYVTEKAGKVCDNYVTGGNAQAAASEITVIKRDTADGYRVSVKGAPDGSGLNVLKDGNVCEIGAGIAPEQQDTVDADNNPIKVKLTPTQTYAFDGTRVTSTIRFEIESDPPGAKGTPCTMSATSTGFKK